MAYVEPLDAEVEMKDPLALRIALTCGFLGAVGLCLAFWAAVIVGLYELV
jgi:hypothetical protein